MSLAAIIDAMVASGCSGEQVAAAVRAHEAELEAAAAQKRAKASARKARWRANNVHACPRDETGHDGTERDMAGHTPSPKERSPTPPKEITPSPSSLRSVSSRAREAFDRFWSAYPKREGSNPKQTAQAKFLRLVAAGEDVEAIILGARRYAAAVAHEDPRFTAQAITWLNQGRWTDEHRPPARAGPRQSNRDMLAELCHADEPDPFDDQRSDPRHSAPEGTSAEHQDAGGFAGRLPFEDRPRAGRDKLVDH